VIGSYAFAASIFPGGYSDAITPLIEVHLTIMVAIKVQPSIMVLVEVQLTILV
jgi:hypothetical protein